MILIHCLLVFPYLLNELGGSLDDIKWCIDEGAYLHCLDVRFVQKLIVWNNLYLSIEISRHYEQLLRGPQTKCNVLRVFLTFVN